MVRNVLFNLTIKARNGEVWIIHGLSLKLRIIGKTVRKVIEKFQSKTWVVKFFWIVVMGVFQFVINVQNAPLNGINTWIVRKWMNGIPVCQGVDDITVSVKIEDKNNEKSFKGQSRKQIMASWVIPKTNETHYPEHLQYLLRIVSLVCFTRIKETYSPKPHQQIP